jgi:hypothetical protein
MQRLEFFGNAVFVPVFLVSIGLLLEPSVMFQLDVLGLAGLMCACALGGKLIACWLAGSLQGATYAERLAMYVLTAPQAAATLAVTLVGFEIGVFGTSVVNAVLVLILVSIVLSAVLAERVVKLVPAQLDRIPRIGERVVLVTFAAGPSEEAVRTASLLVRPDGGRGDVVVTRSASEPAPQLAEVERRVVRNGLDGHVRSEISGIADAVDRAILNDQPSVVIVDDPGYAARSTTVPVLVVPGFRLNVDGEAASEIERRLGATRE